MDRVNIDLVDVDTDRELGGDRKAITAFEIQVLNKGDWRIDSIFDDQELATFEANFVFGRGVYDAVLVVQENYNEMTNTASVRTITELTKAVAKKVSAQRSLRRAYKEDELVVQDLAEEGSQDGTKDFSILWWFGLIPRSVGIAIAGLVVLYLLRLLYEM